MTSPATLIRARFGIPMEYHASRSRTIALHAAAATNATEIHHRLTTGEIAFITGPSGSGKSLLMQELQRVIHDSVVATPIPDRARKPTIEMLRSSVESRLRLLSACGLADAHPLVTPAGRLSDGQKARLSIAQAFENAELFNNACTILVDEFCSTLDRTTAASVATSVRRMVRTPLRLICASANDDLIEHLRPDVLVYVPLEGTPEILTRNDTCTAIPGRSCPNTSESDSQETRSTVPGRSVSAKERRTTTPDSPGFTTGLPPPRPSSV
ncbi:MAG: hypothetical protein KDA31_00335 [Phycisphaerales bacterium]|nr:hypothetical protein [Phycisphaerales bacterium]MCB9835994.1 hypothetical protein [Phycisphaera sp.]